MSGPALPPPPTPARLSPGAVAALLLGLASLVLLFLTGIPAVWFGLNALRSVNASDGRLRGRRLAVAGACLGAFGCAASVLGAMAIVFVNLHVRSQRLECLNNLRQIGGAVLNYQTTNGAFPPATLPNDALPPEKRLSWLAGLPPFMGQNTPTARAMQSLYDQIDPALAWDAGGNAAVARTAAPVCRCPGHPFDPDAPGRTDYVGLAGLGRDAAALPAGDPSAGIFGYDRTVEAKDVTAGASKTLLAAETERDNGPWTAGGPSTVRGLDPADAPYLGPGRAFGGLHPGGLNLLWADGAADFMEDDVSPRLFETLTRLRREADAPAR